MVGLGLVSLADDGIGEGSKESLDDFRCLVELVFRGQAPQCLSFGFMCHGSFHLPSV